MKRVRRQKLDHMLNQIMAVSYWLLIFTGFTTPCNTIGQILELVFLPRDSNRDLNDNSRHTIRVDRLRDLMMLIAITPPT